MSKEPGQIGFEARYPNAVWHRLSQRFKDEYALTDAAIRADERAKVIEALVEESQFHPGRWMMALGGWNYPSKDEAIKAVAIRALGSKP